MHRAGMCCDLKPSAIATAVLEDGVGRCSHGAEAKVTALKKKKKLVVFFY